MMWRSSFSDEEWTTLSLLLGLSVRVIADADDRMVEAEADFLRGLWTGDRAAGVLSDVVLLRLGSKNELAREVLESWTDGVVLGRLTDGGVQDREGLRAPDILNAWVDRSMSTEERQERQAQARGLVHEAFHLGVSAALADGSVNDEELGFLGHLARELGITDAEYQSLWEATAATSDVPVKNGVSPLSLADVDDRADLVGEPGKQVMHDTWRLPLSHAVKPRDQSPTPKAGTRRVPP